MVTASETQIENDWSINPFPIFYDRYNRKLLSPWPNFDYTSILIKSTNEIVFILMSDINTLSKL